MHLEIKQANDRTEQVSSTCIDKLYNLSKNGLLDATSDLRGSINADIAYEDAVTFLNTMWGPNLIVTASTYYIRFADPEVVRVLTERGVIQEGEGLTSAQASAVSIGYNWFSNNSVIESFDELIYFKSNISMTSFEKCTNLKSVNLTNATSIGLDCFRNDVNLEKFHGNDSTVGLLNLPNLITIGNYCFDSCKKLQEVVSLGAISFLSLRGFGNCDALTKVNIPQSCTSLNLQCLYHNPSLTTVNIYHVQSIGNESFSDDTNLEYFNGPNSTQGELNLPNLTGTLNNGAFRGCTKLTSITSLGSIISIGNSTFENCSNLATINFPNTITSVGDKAFNNTAWYNNQPDGGVVIGSCLYKYKGSVVGTYTIPSNITNVSPSCFYGQSSLTGITSWPSNLTTIPTACFQNSGLTSFDLTGIVTIGDGAFRSSNLTSIVIPNSVTTLVNACFYLCSNLTSITIGTGVTALGRSMFTLCSSLETLVIPANVKSLERDTLLNCSSLQWVRLESTTMVSLNNASCFNNTNNCIIYVPSDLVDTYKADSKWSSLASRIQAIPTT